MCSSSSGLPAPTHEGHEAYGSALAPGAGPVWGSIPLATADGDELLEILSLDSAILLLPWDDLLETGQVTTWFASPGPFTSVAAVGNVSTDQPINGGSARSYTLA